MVTIKYYRDIKIKDLSFIEPPLRALSIVDDLFEAYKIELKDNQLIICNDNTSYIDRDDPIRNYVLDLFKEG